MQNLLKLKQFSPVRPPGAADLFLATSKQVEGTTKHHKYAVFWASVVVVVVVVFFTMRNLNIYIIWDL